MQGWLAEAAQFGNSGDLNRAIARCELALTDLPEHVEARTLHGKLTAHRQGAFQQLEQAKAALLSAARLGGGGKQPARSVAACPDVSRGAGVCPAGRQYAAQSAAGRGAVAQLQGQQYEPALAALTEAVRLDSGNSVAQRHLGEARELLFRARQDRQRGARRTAHSVGVPALSRAAELWSSTGNPADAARGEPFRQRAATCAGHAGQARAPSG